MTTQLTAVRLTASASVYGQPSRVRQIWFVGSVDPGTITLKDGGASGTTVAVIDVPASAGVGNTLELVGLGLKFNTNVYAALSNVAGATFFLG